MMVVLAQRGGTFRETIAMSKAYAAARTRHGASELLDSVVGSRPKLDHPDRSSPEAFRQQTLGRLGEAVALLQRMTATRARRPRRGRSPPPHAVAGRGGWVWERSRTRVPLLSNRPAVRSDIGAAWALHRPPGGDGESLWAHLRLTRALARARCLGSLSTRVVSKDLERS